MQTFLLISTVFLWIIVIINLILTLALIRQWRKGEKGRSDDGSLISLEIGQPAPAFTAKSLDGTDVALSSFTRRNVVFLFVRPSCDACHDTLPHYNDLYEEAKRLGADLVLVNFGNAEETFELKKQYRLNLPILYAPSHNSFEIDYKIIGVPSFCFVDEGGIVRRTGYSPELADQLKTMV